eukprot:scaffold252613_cov19-Tisochrysis_lutea.AAC.1
MIAQLATPSNLTNRLQFHQQATPIWPMPVLMFCIVMQRGKELARWTCVGGRSALEIYSGASRLWSTHTLLSNDCKQPATSSPVSSNFCRSWPPCPPGHSAPHAPSGPSYLLRRTGAAGESKRCVVWGNSLARPGPKSSPALHRSILSTW